MSSLFKFILVILAAIIARRAINIIWTLDLFRHIHYHEPGPCKLVPGVEYGSEDLEVTRNGIAYISSGLEVLFGSPVKTVPGKILSFNFNNQQAGVQEVILNGDLDLAAFNPVGVSIWEDPKTGETTVFVINHAAGVPHATVEVFRIDKETVFQHVRTITDPLFRFNNDIVATSSTTFFATNCLYYYGSKLLTTLEILFNLHYADVIYYDGKQAKVVLSGQTFLNGISISPDRKMLYVANTIKEEIGLYDINGDSTLSLKREIIMNMNPDSINVDETTGDIWVAGQALLYKYFSYKNNRNYPATSQVIRISFKQSSSEPFIESVYAEDGVRLFGASVAAKYKNGLLVGTALGKLMYCDIKHLAD